MKLNEKAQVKTQILQMIYIPLSNWSSFHPCQYGGEVNVEKTNLAYHTPLVFRHEYNADSIVSSSLRCSPINIQAQTFTCAFQFFILKV